MQRNAVLFWGVLTLLTLLFAFHQPGVFAETKDKGLRQTEPTTFEVSEDKKQAWENIKSHLRQEYDVCIEHCGSDASCEEKCKKVFNHRKEMEYNKLMQDSRTID